MDSFKEIPDVITVQQLASILHISGRSAYNLIHTGAITHRKIGRIYRIPKTAVIDYLTKQ